MAGELRFAEVWLVKSNSGAVVHVSNSQAAALEWTEQSHHWGAGHSIEKRTAVTDGEDLALVDLVQVIFEEPPKIEVPEPVEQPVEQPPTKRKRAPAKRLH